MVTFKECICMQRVLCNIFLYLSIIHPFESLHNINTSAVDIITVRQKIWWTYSENRCTQFDAFSIIGIIKK